MLRRRFFKNSKMGIYYLFETHTGLYFIKVKTDRMLINAENFVNVNKGKEQ